ncbi:MAG: hypothetical protein AUG91_05870 [Actinobacteria bacterium 13_1_20CM_4_69_9]|nr:MAG: hypothetical protein AUG91_05870 [Actinobacteria bacterium 13_1_20CM_4_69_9]
MSRCSRLLRPHTRPRRRAGATCSRRRRREARRSGRLERSLASRPPRRPAIRTPQLQATLYRNDDEIFSAPIGAGQGRWPTPAGEFYVRERTRGFGNPFYGPVAFGLNARSRVLTDWPGGGFVGIHGTNEPDLIPGRISHGCIRMRNDAILRLARLMPLGTPVTIR